MVDGGLPQLSELGLNVEEGPVRFEQVATRLRTSMREEDVNKEG